MLCLSTCHICRSYDMPYHMPIYRPVWLNDWVFVYELSCSGLESSYSDYAILSWKKTKKTSLRISSKCWCVPIMVMLWNELGDGTAVDMGWFRMLRRDSNTIYGKNIDCVCGEMWRMWYWYVTEKKMKPGGRTRCDEAVNIRGQS